MEEVQSYLHHIGNCGAVDSDDPIDDRCICGLRQVWTKLYYNYKHLLEYIPDVYHEKKE